MDEMGMLLDSIQLKKSCSKGAAEEKILIFCLHPPDVRHT